ncbi:MAG: alpha/beta hydrolase [Aureispira sp.]|nr:alpha/beta hydrolase [Aureispira sp.]
MIKSIVKYSLLLGGGILLYVLFYPQKYDVLAFEKRPNTKYWELQNGSKIGYTLLKGTPSGNKPPIIYLHGGPGGMVSDETIDLLKPIAAKGFDVYLYDQVGSGHSNRLEDVSEYSVSRHKEDLALIVEAIGTEKIILFGHSWGTMLAIDFFADNAAIVEKIICSGPGPILPMNRKIGQLNPPDSLSLITPKYSNKEGNEKAYNLRAKLIRFWATILETKLASDKEADDFFTYLNSQLSKSTTCDGSGVVEYRGGGGYYSHVMTVQSFWEVENKRAKIKDSKVLLLILRGQCDNQKWGYTQEYLNLFPNAQLKIIEGAGHSIEQRYQDKYIKMMEAFLESSTSI